MSVTSQEQAAIRKYLGKESGNMKSPLSFAVVKLFLAPPSGSREWHYTGVCGVLCLTIDREPQCDPKPRILQILEVPSNKLVFQQELYEAMPYEKPREYFHTFETPKYIVGLLFANEEESRGFHSRVLSQIPVPQAGAKTDNAIGNPYNFKHTRHIGYDPNDGFSLDQIPDDWKTLFKNAGIKKKDLTNKETAQMIYNTIQQHADPAGQAPPVPTPSYQPGPPHRAVPGPRPPPPRRRAAPPVPRGRVPAAPPVALGGPPAPPLSVPTAPPMAPALAAGPPRPGPPAPAPAAAAGGGDERGGLLAAIRAGKSLKKVEHNEEDDQALPSMQNMSSAAQGGLLGALQMAMANRRVATAGGDDGEESEDDDDWD